MNGKMSPDAPKHRRTTLKSYASQVFKESAVGMVSSLAQTSSNRRRFFKAFVLIFCLTGFFYQSAKFVAMVFTYPTVVGIDIIRPDSFNLPAYTFCDNNEIKRSLYCKKYPANCKEADENFCEKYEPYCGDNKNLVPKKQYYKLENMSPAEVIELNPKLEDFLLNNSMGFRSEVTGPHLRSKYAEESDDAMLVCYTWNDRADSPLYPIRGNKTGFFKEASNKFTLFVEEDEIFIPGTQSGVLFIIHSPFEAVNPFMKGIFMKPGRTYVIYISMEEEILLKKPYDTDCMNYTEQWELKGHRGPRTQEMCKHKCGLDVTKLCYNCSTLDFLYPDSGDLCSNIDIQNINCPDAEERFGTCTKTCKDDCQRTKYYYQVQERYSVKFDDNGDVLENLDRLIFVEIHIEEDEIIVFTHSPKYMVVEVFSTIGGFVGGWLGISLLDVTDIFEGFFRIFRYSFKKR